MGHRPHRPQNIYRRVSNEGVPLDIIELLKSAFMGLVEGITEWLPVSSTGHMILVDEFVKMNVSETFWNMFLVVIQLGAILAVCVLFFHELNPFSPSKGKEGRRDTWVLWGGDRPAAQRLDGGAFLQCSRRGAGAHCVRRAVYRDRELARKQARGNDRCRFVWFACCGVGWTSRRCALCGATAEDEDDDENLDFGSIATLEDLSWKTALGIGCFQVLSLVPGTSRSGSTIIGGLLLGCTRSVASKFTFFLAIPVMFGASALKLVKYFVKGGTFGANEIAILGVGCIVAFVVSLIAIKWLMGFVRRHDFKCFGVYRIILGIVVLAYFFVLEPMLGL